MIAYEDILDIQKKLLKLNPGEYVSFVDQYQSDLTNILSPEAGKSVTTLSKGELLDLLSLKIQRMNQKKGLTEGCITPLRSVLEWKRKDEMHRNSLYHRFQGAFSNPEDYVHVKDKRGFSFVVVEPNRVPDTLLYNFGLTRVDDPNYSAFKSAFLKFKPIYEAYNEEGFSYRAGTVSGIPFTFSSFPKMIAVEGTPAPVDKRHKHDTVYQYASFDNGYDLWRREWHVSNNLDQDADQCERLKDSLIPLLEDIKFKTKHHSIKEVIQSTIDEISASTSYTLCLSKTYQLEKIEFKNSSVDGNLILGAINAIKKREGAAKSMSDTINAQVPEFLSKFSHHQEAIKDLIDTLYILFYARTDVQFPYDEACEALVSFYLKYENGRYALDMEPFRSFYRQLREAFGHWKSMGVSKKPALKTPLTKDKHLIKLEVIFLGIAKRFAAYELEHRIKMGKNTLPIDRPGNIFNYEKIESLVSSLPIDDQKDFRDLQFPNIARSLELEDETGKEKVFEILQQLQK